ncbi:MAG TPA: tRNA (guanosine(37)-N1)-methyltransferase TrmD [Desulfurella acetivorans]|uniref:tRNA (guanine-N(1)-)-methyltransferase n=1 Tax=Desulfurella acetivorans TaxID=33002 RepID=A0A7C6E9G4_DESAE|nr:tRNA (guanosine(37)-N1)-methyltransferase TrmD [Desulfurella acetivorans]
MRIYLLSIYPKVFESIFDDGILKKAKKLQLAEFEFVNIRDFTTDKHKTVDDYVYGGGPGMLLKPEPIYKAVDSIKSKDKNVFTVILTPEGSLFTQEKAKEYSKKESIAFICGRYEGFDERVKLLADEKVSIGKFIISRGELAASVIVDSIVRLLPGVLGNQESLKEESFEGNFIEYPQYTRPAEFRGLKVPDVLISGNHAMVEKWRKEHSKITIEVCDG